MKRSAYLLVLALSLVGVTHSAWADGELDTSYCNNGQGTFGLGVPYRRLPGSVRHAENVIKKALPSADGSMLFLYESTATDRTAAQGTAIISMPFVIKLKANCQLDTNFGVIDPRLYLGNYTPAALAGITLLSQLTASQRVSVRGGALTSDGHIVIGIQTGNASALVWLNAKGAIDSNFGNRTGDLDLAGITYLPNNFRIVDVAVLSDDSVVVGGTYHSSTGETAVAAMKLSPRGLIVEGFAPTDADHIAHTPINSDYYHNTYATALAIQRSTGNITVVGTTNNDLAIASFTAMGELNPD